MLYKSPRVRSENLKDLTALSGNLIYLSNPNLLCEEPNFGLCPGGAGGTDLWSMSIDFSDPEGDATGGTCNVTGSHANGDPFTNFNCTIGDAECALTGSATQGTISIFGCVSFVDPADSLQITVTCEDAGGNPSNSVSDSVSPGPNCPVQ